MRGTALAALVVIAGLPLASCGGQSGSPTEQVAREMPTTPVSLASRLTKTDATMRVMVRRWRGDGTGSQPPAGLAARARSEQRTIVMLADRPRFAAIAVSLLRNPLAGTVSDLSVAIRRLDRLGAGEPAPRLRLGQPLPLSDLLRYYHAAERRFGVDWSVLAAVNMVESAFGRVRSPSNAGARGPMQFLPATWREYGLGGNIEDPHDAILGAANYLAASGAPGDYFGALQSYNPSVLYAGAVLRIARAIRRDPGLVYVLYLWRP